jgi:hypothetical protein
MQPLRHAHHVGHRHLALVGAAEHGGDVAAHLTPSAFARSSTGVKRSIDSSIEALMFFWLNASLAAENTATSVAPTARARS